MKTQFEDAHAMSIVNSKTFEVPSNTEIENITIGDFLKVCTAGERFWAKVESIDLKSRIFYARVDNDLVNSEEHGLKLGSSIEISPENIYSIVK